MPRATNIIGIVLAQSLLIMNAQAEDTSARVLPQGVSLFDATFYQYFPIENRYGAEGDSEALAADFNTELNSRVFPALSGLNLLVGGNATLGQSVVESRLTSRLSEFNLAYGLTEKSTLVVKIPYGYVKNEIRASLDASQANVGKNPLFGTPSDPFRSPLTPIAAGGIRLSDEDIQNLLGKGLDVNRDGVADIPGYGYERFETFSDNGIGDVELYAKYQFYDQKPWRLALASGLRFPTGKVKDIDNLAALDFGDGQTDILFRFHADYGVTENLQLNFTTRYDLQLPDRQTLRVPQSVDQPITRDIEEVDRNLGDVFGLDLIGLYQFTLEWSASLRYSFARKFQDDIDGDPGLVYSSLEQESESENQRVAVTFGYSTLRRYQDKTAKIPFYANLGYRSRFAGKNTVVSRYVSLNIGALF
ncbi:MAG: hypothetical protein P9F19_00495 [Candidatus Contendobacter sp.]|nr:hypothetical protein [Candidatus Contendobacter sp.]MDG4555865.1 hypothetical protein [Candidatus Contendobacter sp.]